MGLNKEFWRDRRVVVTGHTGFKGAWLCLWLQHLGAVITGIALPPIDESAAYPSLEPWEGVDSHIADIRDGTAVAAVMAEADPEVVFHLAAQPLVSRGHEDPTVTYETNVLGTLYVLEACRAPRNLKALVVVSTDKVYSPRPSQRPFREEDPLGGSDPYSTSKACSELVVDTWRRSSTVPVATARAGNVLGGGDVAPDRLLPDLVRAISADAPLRVRRPDAIRPWQFVLDPLHGYLLLAELLADDASDVPTAINFGPPIGATYRVSEVIEIALQAWGRGSWEPIDRETYPEREVLELDPALAASALVWSTQLDIKKSIAWTVGWYSEQLRGGDLRHFSLGQISEFESLLA